MTPRWFKGYSWFEEFECFMDGEYEIPKPLRQVPGESARQPVPGAPSVEQRLVDLKRRLVREGTSAVSMLEDSLDALWLLDAQAAARVRTLDDAIDNEEVAIEQECYDILALRNPYAHNFRLLTFCLRANSDLERVGDHANSIAKIAIRLRQMMPAKVTMRWPTALRELGDRVPARCHDVLRAILDEDTAAARAIVQGDSVIDELERKSFDEVQELVRLMGKDDAAVGAGLLVYRVGRELERVGDLMASIAEDVVYLTTGQIIRHEKRRRRQG